MTPETLSLAPSDAPICSAFLSALARLHAQGISRISANCLANELWPNARHNNSHGQSFNLAAGIAGRMLRKNRGCYEVKNRVWEIIPEFLPNGKDLARRALDSE